MTTGIATLDQAYQTEKFTPLNHWLTDSDKYVMMRKKKTVKYNREIKTRRNDLYRCPVCDRVYQSGGKIEYLDHFPKCAGVIRTCPKCSHQR